MKLLLEYLEEPKRLENWAMTLKSKIGEDPGKPLPPSPRNTPRLKIGNHEMKPKNSSMKLSMTNLKLPIGFNVMIAINGDFSMWMTRES